jgi:hypothetical protein
VINNRTYRGQLESLAVFNALCAGFKDKPHACKKTLATTHIDQTIDEDTVSGGTVVLIVFLVILINMTVVWCYRRYNKREMN